MNIEQFPLIAEAIHTNASRSDPGALEGDLTDLKKVVVDMLFEEWSEDELAVAEGFLAKMPPEQRVKFTWYDDIEGVEASMGVTSDPKEYETADLVMQAIYDYVNEE